MSNWIQRTLNPNGYHGEHSHPPFFEGWYFKLIDASRNLRFAIIPGVFIGKDTANNHAFVQVFNGQTGAVKFFRFPYEQFKSMDRRFDILIGNNHFTAETITLDLKDDEMQLQGVVNFTNTHPWPSTFISPGIMGWFSWIPLMECFHGVVSLDHEIQGSIFLNGLRMSYDGGRGYIEKDWGRSFPSAWVWTQSNHFRSIGTSLTASIAIIPWIGQAFRGFIIGFRYESTLYRFATYTGAVVEKLDVTDSLVKWSIRDKRYRLVLEIPRSHGGVLHAPRINDMNGRVAETLTASIGVRLETLAGDQILEDVGECAGLEVVGDIPRLVAMK
jgi:tocopherol cyclase